MARLYAPDNFLHTPHIDKMDVFQIELNCYYIVINKLFFITDSSLKCRQEKESLRNDALFSLIPQRENLKEVPVSSMA